ncbi:MAG: PAS domain-containing sensor histidine kinase [Candidatus Methylomirabilales bacterium]
MLLLGPEGRITFASPDAERILGCAPGLAAGRQPEQVLGPDHPLLPLLRGAGDAPHLRGVRLEAGREVRAARFALPGPPRGTLLLLQELPPPEAASLPAQAARLLEHGRLASDFAHEIRNPLNAVAIHLELLRRDLPGAAAGARRSLEVIGREVGRIERLVQGLVRCLRLGRFELAPLKVSDLLQQATARLGAEPAGRVASSLAPGAPAVVLADAALLSEALAQLLRNALEASPATGPVLLRAECGADGGLALGVEDRGPGIPPEELDRVFQLYYSTKPDGPGVGLPLARGIARLHGGHLRLESRPGQGTAAILTLPAGLVPALEPVASA